MGTIYKVKFRRGRHEQHERGEAIADGSTGGETAGPHVFLIGDLMNLQNQKRAQHSMCSPSTVSVQWCDALGGHSAAVFGDHD